MKFLVIGIKLVIVIAVAIFFLLFPYTVAVYAGAVGWMPFLALIIGLFLMVIFIRFVEVAEVF